MSPYSFSSSVGFVHCSTFESHSGSSGFTITVLFVLSYFTISTNDPSAATIPFIVDADSVALYSNPSIPSVSGLAVTSVPVSPVNV